MSRVVSRLEENPRISRFGNPDKFNDVIELEKQYKVVRLDKPVRFRLLNPFPAQPKSLRFVKLVKLVMLIFVKL